MRCSFTVQRGAKILRAATDGELGTWEGSRHNKCWN